MPLKDLKARKMWTDEYYKKNRERIIARSRRWYLSKRKAGKCVECDKEIRWDSKRCTKCSSIESSIISRYKLVGRKHTEETKRLMSLHTTGPLNSQYGKPHSEEHKRKISEAVRLEKHPLWKGGKSYEGYSFEFNSNLKSKIRRRDKYSCRWCKLKTMGTGIKLVVHHIDYNKYNCDWFNLISLCSRCHGHTNFNQEIWEARLTKIVMEEVRDVIQQRRISEFDKTDTSV